MPASRRSSVLLPEPEGPVTPSAGRREARPRARPAPPGRRNASQPVHSCGDAPRGLRRRCGARHLGAWHRAPVRAAPRGVIRMPRAVGPRRPVACRCPRGEQLLRHAQPAAATDDDRVALRSSRAHASGRRPSRMWTMRSAIRVDSGSWLTITVVHRCRARARPAAVDLVGGCRVELAGRFVGEEQHAAGARPQRRRDALLLAAGELVGARSASRRGRRARGARPPGAALRAVAPAGPSCRATSSRAVSSGDSDRV